MIIFVTLLSWGVLQAWGTAAAVQCDSYFWSWCDWVETTLGETLGELPSRILILLGPVLLLALLLHLFGGWFFGLLGLVITVIAVLYACGRGNYRSDLLLYRDALSYSDDAGVCDAAQEYQRKLGSAASDEVLDVDAAQAAVLRAAAYLGYQRWFAALFWFVLLGAPAAVFYRCCHLLAYSAEGRGGVHGDEQQQAAIALVGWLDWIPVRLWGFGYALIADFGRVFDRLQSQMNGEHSAIDVISSVQAAALTSATSAETTAADNGHSRSDELAEVDALLSLAGRTTVVMLVAVAILVLVV